MGAVVKSLTFRLPGFRRMYGLAELGEAAKETRFFLPSHPSSLRNRPGQPWVARGARTPEEPASGPEGRQDPVPGSRDGLSPPLHPGAFLRGYEHVHTAGTHTSRQTWEDRTGGRTPGAMVRGYERLGENDRPTRAPGSGRSAPLHFTASPHSPRPHLIPESGQMALPLAQSPPMQRGRGGGLRAP